MDKRDNCPDCGCGIGQEHGLGCDVERCSVCGQQFISCEHDNDDHNSELTVWTGYWPGIKECHDLNLWCKWVPGKGWESCSKDDPNSQEDLNTLYSKYTYKNGEWVKK